MNLFKTIGFPEGSVELPLRNFELEKGVECFKIGIRLQALFAHQPLFEANPIGKDTFFVERFRVSLLFNFQNHVFDHCWRFNKKTMKTSDLRKRKFLKSMPSFTCKSSRCSRFKDFLWTCLFLSSMNGENVNHLYWLHLTHDMIYIIYDIRIPVTLLDERDHFLEVNLNLNVHDASTRQQPGWLGFVGG